MNLLIIEDEPSMVLSLSLALSTADFEIDSASDGQEGLELALTNKYNLILLDCNLPKLSGFEIVKRLRAAKCTVPIIILTVLGELNDKLELFNLGADDYLIKPFAFSELLARIKALLRRPRSMQGKILKIGNLELDADKFLVTKDGVRIPMSSREFSLLEYLMINKEKYLSHQSILDNVWDENANPFSNTVEVHIMNIRKKLETKNERYIFTASNRGYKIDIQR
jgi:two-component system copper resistance phosphate regulon response regulator CusR